jgi:hypothetical protein
MNTVNYQVIFTDIIKEVYPDRLHESNLLHQINNISNFMDVLNVNKIIFNKAGGDRNKQQQRLKIYTHQDVLDILNYQKEYHLSNTETANHFCMSRNTLKKWKDRCLHQNL